MNTNVKVQTELIENVEFEPATSEGPWTVRFADTAPSAELQAWLTNPDGLAGVEVEIDEVAHTGEARIITSATDFLLVGRTDLTPVA